MEYKTTKARRDANKRYDQKRVDRVLLRLPKGQRDVVKAHAESQGEKMNEFIKRAIKETISRDNSEK